LFPRCKAIFGAKRKGPSVLISDNTRKHRQSRLAEVVCHMSQQETLAAVAGAFPAVKPTAKNIATKDATKDTLNASTRP
jgi:hypothetical protein